MDEAPRTGAYLGNPLVAGGVDHGTGMEINPIDFVLLALAIALFALWCDR